MFLSIHVDNKISCVTLKNMKTVYSISHQLYLIQSTNLFEKTSFYLSQYQWILHGLNAVYDVTDAIH